MLSFGTTGFNNPYPSWRIRGKDKQWHRVKTYIFKYHGDPYSTNTTFCDQVIIDPIRRSAFVDVGWRWGSLPEPEPTPACEVCIAKVEEFNRPCPTCGRRG